LKKAGIEALFLPIPSTLKGLNRGNNIARLLKSLPGTITLPRLIGHVVRVLKEKDVRVVHCNHPYAYVIGGIAARCAGVPCIWHFHDVWEPGWITSCFMLSARLLPDQLVANSEATAMRLPRGWRPPLRIIYNGFNFAEFRRAQGKDPSEVRREFGVAPGAVLIGYVSHLAPYKGQAVFLRALGEVVKAFPSVRALVVGGLRKSFEHFPQELRELSSRLGVSGNVHFTGIRRDIPDIMAALDLFVCVSATEEFNCVMVEAMCMGKPAILSNVRGESVVVRDGVTGLLVPPNDPDSLARALVRLIQDEGLRRRLGAAGRRHVEETFPIEKEVAELGGLYDDLLRRKARRRPA
jgi:glycosyltransferase involved in cell wall biosynthesis